MKEWEEFRIARKSELKAIGGISRLPAEVQAKILESALKSGEVADVLDYLHTIEDPAHSAATPVSEMIIQPLRTIAESSGLHSSLVSEYLQTLLKGLKQDFISNGRSTPSPQNEKTEMIGSTLDMGPWNAFLTARKKYRDSFTAFRRLSPETQSSALFESLKASQTLDVFAFLLEAEDPRKNDVSRSVSELMMEWLVDVAAFPGEHSGDARAFLEALANDGKRLDKLGELLDRKTKATMADPGDDEVWLNTAALLRDVDATRFEAFLEVCRFHESSKIREVATFFDD